MRIRPLHPDFGAEVLDCDLPRPVAREQIAELRAAYDTHQLLLFRCDQALPPERQVEITGWFGPPAPVVNDAQGKLWTYMDNRESYGGMRLQFHSDITYTDAPLKAISLHALELPQGPTTTSFVSGMHAWKTLPPDRQELLAPMTVRHRLESNHIADWPEYVADHPVRLIHPRTGRPILFVTEHHAERIHELAPEVSDHVLAELFAHLYAPERIYVHPWTQYDFVMWDNLAVQHARTEEAKLSAGRRLLQRVALNEIGMSELTARARQRQRVLQAS